MNPRLRVIVPGLLLGQFWSMLCMGSLPFPFGMALGPFAMPLGIPEAHPDYSEQWMWTEAVFFIAMIASHPIKPSGTTAVLCGLGMFLWFFVGLMYLTDGV